ncbi:sprT domain-containing protein, partial [Pseudomonas donghuensis]|nr:sprT domain-containing protein [Pseudomonas donghuensis]
MTTSTRDLGKAAITSAASTAHNKQQHLVLAIEMCDGHHFLSAVNPHFARELNNQLNSISEVSHHSWFITEDSWFD